MCDEPVDMSTNKSDAKKEKRGPSPDVIVLSDNESSSPTANGYCKDEEIGNDFIKSSTPEEREKMIKRLKDELRLEEAKLVLLKKLRQSQMQKENVTQKPAAPHGTGSASAPPPLVRGSQQQQQLPGTRLPAQQQMTMPRNQGSVVPPPLVRGGQQGPPKFSHHQSSQVVMPPLVRGPQMHGSRPGTAPPPLMMAPRVTTPSQMQGSRGLSSSGLVRVTTVTPPTSGVVNYTQSMVRGSGGASSSPTPARSESPASRQAAAKLALRKQLEKTLLEIPPPKPPPPELNFLPSAANSEFVYLIGLEEVVQSLLETQGKAAPQPMGREPFKCLQCQTDFTARWRHEKGGTVICEQCLSSNQKKALKAEHTNRLKMAFVKALQQEQEIEQQIQQQTVSTPTQNAKSHMQQLPLKQQSTRPSQSMVQRGHQPPHRGVLHSFPQPPQMQASSKLLGLQGKAQVRPQARPQGGAGRARRHAVASHSAGVNMAYVTPNLSGQHKPSTSTAASPAERQREYLLDMLPSRPISHPTVHRPVMGSRTPSQLSHGARVPMQHGGASRATAHPQQHGSRAMGHHSQATGRAVPGTGSSPSGRSMQQPSANRAVNQTTAHGRSLAQGNAARSVTQPAGSWK